MRMLEYQDAMVAEERHVGGLARRGRDRWSAGGKEVSHKSSGRCFCVVVNAIEV